MKINISGLSNGTHEFEFVTKPQDFDIDELSLDGDINAKIELYKTDGQITVDITLTGRYKLQCDRCLDNYETDFNQNFGIVYKTDFTGDLIGQDPGDDDLKYILPNSKDIDLKQDIRDYILLSIPMRKVPEEKDGKCTYCNRDIEEVLKIDREEKINPVWEKLLTKKK